MNLKADQGMDKNQQIEGCRHGRQAKEIRDMFFLSESYQRNVLTLDKQHKYFVAKLLLVMLWHCFTFLTIILLSISLFRTNKKGPVVLKKLKEAFCDIYIHWDSSQEIG